MLQVEVNYGIDGRPTWAAGETNGQGRSLALLREPEGKDEWAISATDVGEAIRLIDRLLVADDTLDQSLLRPGESSLLVPTDRDRILGHLSVWLFGPQIPFTLNCSACAEPFDGRFDLADLIDRALACDEAARTHFDGDDFVAGDGRRFDLPTGRQELTASRLSVDRGVAALVRHCVGDPSVDSDVVGTLEAALEQVVPVLDVDLVAACAICGEPHRVRFDIQRYILGQLLMERTQLLDEVHAIAAVYGWSLAEILSLPRGHRRVLSAKAETVR